MKRKTFITIIATALFFFGCEKKKEIRLPEKIAKPEEQVEVKKDVTIKTISVIGDASIIDSIKNFTKRAKPNMLLKKHNIAKTEVESRMEIQLGHSESMLIMNENTQVTIGAVLAHDTVQKTEVDLPLGNIFISAQKLIGRNEQLLVQTPTATVAIRGTGFEVAVDKNTGATDVSVMEGNVVVRDRKHRSRVIVKPAETVRIERNKKPTRPRRIGEHKLVKIKKWVGPQVVKKLSGRMDSRTRKLLRIRAADIMEKGMKSAIKKDIKYIDKKIKHTDSKLKTVKKKQLKHVNKKLQQKKNITKKKIDQKTKKAIKNVEKKTKEDKDKIKKKALKAKKKLKF